MASPVPRDGFDAGACGVDREREVATAPSGVMEEIDRIRHARLEILEHHGSRVTAQRNWRAQARPGDLAASETWKSVLVDLDVNGWKRRCGHSRAAHENENGSLQFHSEAGWNTREPAA